MAGSGEQRVVPKGPKVMTRVKRWYADWYWRSPPEKLVFFFMLAFAAVSIGLAVLVEALLPSR